jgi:hypothetical protein
MVDGRACRNKCQVGKISKREKALKRKGTDSKSPEKNLLVKSD